MTGSESRVVLRATQWQEQDIAVRARIAPRARLENSGESDSENGFPTLATSCQERSSKALAPRSR